MLKKRTIERVKAEERKVNYYCYPPMNIKIRVQPETSEVRIWCTLSVAEHYKFWSQEQRKIARKETSQLHNKKIKFRKI